MPFKPNITNLSGTSLLEYENIISQIDTAASSSYTGGWKFSVTLSGTFSDSTLIGSVRDAYMSEGSWNQRRWTTVEFQSPYSGSTIVTLYSHNGRNKV